MVKRPLERLREGDGLVMARFETVGGAGYEGCEQQGGLSCMFRAGWPAHGEWTCLSDG